MALAIPALGMENIGKTKGGCKAIV
jgi:hypothetical protein